ncbi:unnamed protein product, partial [Trichogramma brassicae]
MEKQRLTEVAETLNSPRPHRSNAERRIPIVLKLFRKASLQAIFKWLYSPQFLSTFRCKPMLVYKAENPRALKNKRKDHLPVVWKSNKTAWVTKKVHVDKLAKIYITCMIFPREFINCPRGIDVLSTLFPRIIHPRSASIPPTQLKIVAWISSCISYVESMLIGDGLCVETAWKVHRFHEDSILRTRETCTRAFLYTRKSCFCLGKNRNAYDFSLSTWTFLDDPRGYFGHRKNEKKFLPDIRNWVGIRDTFKEMSIDHSNLPNIFKMNYLRIQVKGEAAELLQEVLTCDDPRGYFGHRKNEKKFLPDIRNWVGIRDTFKEMSIDHSNLPNIFKMNYLRIQVKGEAAELLQEVLTCDDPRGYFGHRKNEKKFLPDIRNWVGIRDTFKEMSIDHSNLPNIFKMNYLRIQVKGEAAELLQEVLTCAERAAEQTSGAASGLARIHALLGNAWPPPPAVAYINRRATTVRQIRLRPKRARHREHTSDDEYLFQGPVKRKRTLCVESSDEESEKRKKIGERNEDCIKNVHDSLHDESDIESPNDQLSLKSFDSFSAQATKGKNNKSSVGGVQSNNSESSPDESSDDERKKSEEERIQDRERAEQQRQDRERAEQQRQNRERAEQQRQDRERAEQQRQNRERAEQQRQDRERAEQQRQDQEREDRERGIIIEPVALPLE